MSVTRSIVGCILAAIPGCVEPAAPTLSPCTSLFGSPNARTGLDDTRCRPSCACGDGSVFVPRVWTPRSLALLRALTLLNPPEALTADPYLRPAPAPATDATVCAAVFSTATSYRMQTFARASEAVAAGGIVSHSGACGVCSGLADLAVYAGTPDLTAPVRACGVLHGDTVDALVTCLSELGFTRPCAQVWAYNTLHTRARCLDVCVAQLNAPYHTADGGLNACLTCDEVQSGAVFKAIAGRTRRNSGLANAMCRPCDEVVRLRHEYPGS